MRVEIALAAWSAAGFAWWIIAWRLMTREARAKPSLAAPALARSLSIFKPLPPLGARGLDHLSGGLESFIAQLDSVSEVLLGVHEADRAVVGPFVEEMRARYPKGQVRAIYRPGPDAVQNPKIAWQMHLAPLATGELWLWSDADIVAPPGFLQAARAEYARCGAAVLTFPYVVRRAARPGALFEALFVNADFYPGVLLLRGFGAVDFGLGAGMLFERESFLRNVDWSELGAFLADDFQLGQRFGPVRISEATLETVPAERTWSSALQHDLRWAKTIRWNRPGGYFARLLVLPVLGWLGAVMLHPQEISDWAGLLGMMQADVLFAAVICRTIGCHIRGGDLVKMECWSLWRIAVWILCWLPGPVTWSGRTWRGPQADYRIEVKQAPSEVIDIP